MSSHPSQNPSLSFCDVRLVGVAGQITVENGERVTDVKVKNRKGELVRLKVVMPEGAFCAPGEAIRVFGEVGPNGEIRCEAPYGEFVSVGVVRTEPAAARQAAEDRTAAAPSPVATNSPQEDTASAAAPVRQAPPPPVPPAPTRPAVPPRPMAPPPVPRPATPPRPLAPTPSMLASRPAGAPVMARPSAPPPVPRPPLPSNTPKAQPASGGLASLRNAQVARPDDDEDGVHSGPSEPSRLGAPPNVSPMARFRPVPDEIDRAIPF